MKSLLLGRAYLGMGAVIAIFVAACSKSPEQAAKAEAPSATEPGTSPHETQGPATAAVGHAAAGVEAGEAAAVWAVKFHADYCGACKAIDPALQAVKTDFASAPVRFVQFDLTSEKTTAHSETRAAELGLTEVYRQHAPKTGYVLLVDPSSKAILGKLTMHHDKAAWHAEIKKLVDRAQGT